MLGRQKDRTRALRAPVWLAGAMALALCHAASAAPAAQDASARYDAQDARLNAVYKKLSQSLDAAGRTALRDEERQWIAGRDQSCGVATGSVVKNDCTTTQTSFRADELDKRVKAPASTSPGKGGASIAGDWGYRSDCNLGHAAGFAVTASSASSAEGTWSDGTHVTGSQGQFKGEWRDGKLYVRFCAEDSDNSGYPACPAYGDVTAYVVPEGKHLAWYRADGPAAEGKFSKYVALDRVPKGGRAPLDKQCKDSQ